MKAWMRPSRRSMRSRHARVASTGDILRAAIARPSVSTVQPVTRLGRARVALERQHEARRLLTDREIGGDPLDGGRETGGIRAHASPRGAHDVCAIIAPSHARWPNAAGMGLSTLTRPPPGC